MSLLVQVCLPILVALLTLVAGYFLNSFPEIKGLSGKWGALIRSTIWLTLGTVALEVFADNEASSELKRTFAFVGVVVATALLYEVCAVGWAIWQAKQHEGNSENTKQEAPQTLKARLVNEVRFRVQERLDYAVGGKSLMEVPMEPAPNEVGRESRPPAPKTRVALWRYGAIKLCKFWGESAQKRLWLAMCSQPLTISMWRRSF